MLQQMWRQLQLQEWYLLRKVLRRMQWSRLLRCQLLHPNQQLLHRLQR